MSHRTGEGMPGSGDEAAVPAKDAPVLIIGGAGFIGTNLAHRLLQNGYRVRIYDNLSRRGTEHNLRWLADARSGSSQTKLDIHNADLRDRPALRLAIGDAGVVFHLAAQVAVTASLDDPESDFAINAAGTLGLLEELRALTAPPPLVFTSTNKVYGSLDHIQLIEEGSRYQPVDPDVRAHGVSEATPLCFRSPYGCSKGAADQYVLDYAATFALPAAVFRMSCIYGPHQHGTAEQGWIAHFVRSALAGYGVTIYGDGKQVRDVLFVDDLVNALLLAWQHIRMLAGRAFNIGGGPERALSVLDLITLIRAVTGADTPIRWAPWRPADQRYFVSDIRGFRHATGWSPNVDIARGVALLGGWLASQSCPHESPSHDSGAPARVRALTTTDIAASNT